MIELSMIELDSVVGGKPKVTLKPKGGIPPKGGEVTVKIPIGPTNDAPSGGGVRDFGKEAGDLFERNERNSGRGSKKKGS